MAYPADLIIPLFVWALVWAIVNFCLTLYMIFDFWRPVKVASRAMVLDEEQIPTEELAVIMKIAYVHPSYVWQYCSYYYSVKSLHLIVENYRAKNSIK